MIIFYPYTTSHNTSTTKSHTDNFVLFSIKKRVDEKSLRFNFLNLDV